MHMIPEIVFWLQKKLDGTIAIFTFEIQLSQQQCWPKTGYSNPGLQLIGPLLICKIGTSAEAIAFPHSAVYSCFTCVSGAACQPRLPPQPDKAMSANHV